MWSPKAEGLGAEESLREAPCCLPGARPQLRRGRGLWTVTSGESRGMAADVSTTQAPGTGL